VPVTASGADWVCFVRLPLISCSDSEQDYFIITNYDDREQAIRILQEPKFTNISCVHRKAGVESQEVHFGIKKDGLGLDWRSK
jgi:hypothetical protein